jgi:hypothetical protein
MALCYIRLSSLYGKDFIESADKAVILCQEADIVVLDFTAVVFTAKEAIDKLSKTYPNAIAVGFNLTTLRKLEQSGLQSLSFKRAYRLLGSTIVNGKVSILELEAFRFFWSAYELGLKKARAELNSESMGKERKDGIISIINKHSTII